MSTILDSRNAELIYLLFDLFCSLSLHRKEDENQCVIDSIFKDTLKLLLRDVEPSIKLYLLNTLSKYRNHKDFNEIASTMLHEEELKNELKLYCDLRDKCISTEWQERLTQSRCNEFTHKCNQQTLDNRRNIESDLGDFTAETDEPPDKKPKLECDEVDSIIERLENDSLILSLMEEITLSDNSKKRIADVIEKLKNIVS